MAFFKWLFGYKDYFLYQDEAYIQEELEIFERYVQIFKEKKKALLDWDNQWYKGNLKKLTREVKLVKDIIKKELDKNEKERHICKLIFSRAFTQKFIDDVGQLNRILAELQENLEKQLDFFKNFPDLPNELNHKLIINNLIQKEEMLLFGEHHLAILGEGQVLELILKEIEEKKKYFEQRRKIVFPNIDRNYGPLGKLDKEVYDEDVLTYLRKAPIGEIPSNYNEESRKIATEFTYDFRKLMYDGGVVGTSLVIHEKFEIFTLMNFGYALNRIIDVGPSMIGNEYKKAHNSATIAQHKYLQSVARKYGYRLSIGPLIITDPLFIGPDVYYPQFQMTIKAQQGQIKDLEKFGIKGHLISSEELETAAKFYRQVGFPPVKFDIVQVAKQILGKK